MILNRHLMVVSSILIGLLGMSILLIRGQAYDDGGLPHALLDGGCMSPCFLGLQPGRTKVADAVDRLAAEGSLEAQVQYRVANRLRYQMINWGGFLFYPLQNSGQMDLTPEVAAQEAFVEAFFVRLGRPLTLGDVYVSLGYPSDVDLGFWYHDLGTEVSVILNHQYANNHVTIITRHLCPVQSRLFWQTPVLAIRFGAQPLSSLRQIRIDEVLKLRDCR